MIDRSLLHPMRSRVGSLRRGLRLLGLGLAVGVCALGCGGGIDERMLEATALQDAGDFSRSIEPLRDVLAQDPSHAEANHRLGLALVQTRQPTLAIWPLRKAAESEEYAVQSGLLLATTLLSTDAFEEASAAATEVLEKDPNNAAALVARAQAASKAGDSQASLVDADAALTLEPDNEHALVTRAVALTQLERLDEAEESLKQLEAALRAGGEPDAGLRGCVALATFYIDKQLEAAEAKVEQCVAEFPANAKMLQLASVHYDRKGESGKADDLYRQAIEEAPDQMALRGTLANRLRGAGKPDEAATVLREAAEQFDDVSAWDRLAGFYLELGDLDQAREANERALAARGGEGSPILVFRKADLLIAEGKLDEAEALVADLDSTYRDAIHGKVLLERGDAAGALEAFESSLLRWPNNAGVRFLAGRAAEQLGEAEKAASHYREANRSDETQTDAGLLLAKLYMDSAQYDKAWMAAGKYVQNRPFSGPEGHVILARAAARGGRLDEARKALSDLARKEGMKGRAVLELAAIERSARGPAAAVTVIEKSELDLTDPENEAILRTLSDALVADGRPDEARKRVEAAAARHPEAAYVYDIRARLEVAEGRSEKARADFQRALEVDPEFAKAHAALANLDLLAGDLDAALVHAERAVELDPSDADARYVRASILFAQGKQDEGLAALRALTDESPTHLAAANDLAWRLAERKEDLELALELALRAVRIDNRMETLDTLGWVQLRSGDADAAVESFERALEKRQDPSVRYRLGLALEAQGRTEEAREQIQGALDAGSFPEAEEARAQLAALGSAAGAMP